MRLPLLALLAGIAFAQPQAASKPAAIDQIFSRFTRTTPGCAIGVSEAGKVIHTAGYGLADLERQVPITAQTVFESGSVAKQFTAAAVLLLAQQGLLSLDDPLAKYLPELAAHGPSLTIRHVLHHTSGLREWRLPATLSGLPEGTFVYSNEDLLRLASRQQGLNFNPGDAYSYSNTGFNALPILIERVANKGQTFTAFTHDAIFAPLQMNTTRWRTNFRDIIPQRALAYARAKNTWTNQTPIENIYGAGGLLTTVEDLLRWNDNFTHARVGGPAFVKLQQTPATLNSGRPITYAFGLMVSTYLGHPEVAHSGATGGYRTYLARYPNQQLSLAILCNSAEANPTDLAHRVAQLWLGPPPPPPTSSYTPTAEEIQRFNGFYRNKNTNAVSRFEYKPGGPLVALAPNEFRQGTSTYRLSPSDPLTLEITDPNNVTVYEKFSPATPTLAQLKDYVGLYRSDETNSTLEISIRDTGLVYRIGHLPAQPLTPTYPDGFEHRGQTFFTFYRSPAIDSVLISDPRTWGLRFLRIK